MVRPGQQRVDDLGRAGPRVGGGVPAAVEQQRPPRAARAERGDPAGHQVMVAGLVDRLDGALHPGQRAVQDRTRRRGGPCHPGELVRSRAPEPPGQLLLPVREHVGAEVPGPLDHRPAGRGTAGAEQHQRRFQRQRGERLAGEPGHRGPGRGDNRDAGAEVAEDLPELVSLGGKAVAPQADGGALPADPGGVVDEPAVGTVLHVEPAGGAYVERHHQVVGVPPQRARYLRAAPGAPVQRPPHVVQRRGLDHQVHDAGLGGHRRQGQRVMPRVAAEEAEPDRGVAGFAAEEFGWHAHRVAQPEAEDLGVKAERGLVRYRQHHVPQAQVAGDEAVPVRADRRPAVQRSPAEEFQLVPGRVLGGQHRAHPPGGELVIGAGLVRDAGVGQGAADRGQRGGVGDLPARGEQAVG